MAASEEPISLLEEEDDVSPPVEHCPVLTAAFAAISVGEDAYFDGIVAAAEEKPPRSNTPSAAAEEKPPRSNTPSASAGKKPRRSNTPSAPAGQPDLFTAFAAAALAREPHGDPFQNHTTYIKPCGSKNWVQAKRLGGALSLATHT